MHGVLELILYKTFVNRGLSTIDGVTPPAHTGERKDIIRHQGWLGRDRGCEDTCKICASPCMFVTRLLRRLSMRACNEPEPEPDLR